MIALSRKGVKDPGRRLVHRQQSLKRGSRCLPVLRKLAILEAGHFVIKAGIKKRDFSAPGLGVDSAPIQDTSPEDRL